MAELRRINLGGTAFTDSQGNDWEASSGFGSPSTYSHARDVFTTNSTGDEQLYQTGIIGTSLAGSYTVPNSDYTIRLHFAEHVDHLVASGETVNTVVTEAAKTDIAVTRHWQDAILYDESNDDIYYFWIETGGNPRRLMCNKNGSSSVELANDVSGDNHGGPSVGLDKLGYIHCIYDIHQNLPAEGDHYIVSKSPRDIGAGISDWYVYDNKYAETNPPRTSTLNASGVPIYRGTYPHFLKDPVTKELYLAARSRVGNSASNPYCYNCEPGAQGIPFLHLETNTDPTDQNWAELGGSSHANYPYDIDCLFWNKSAKSGGAGSGDGYQEYQSRFYFDLNGRLHAAVITFVYSDGAGEASHAMYAYTDDPLSNVWRKSDGSVISDFPIQATPGQDDNNASNGDVVATDLGADLGDTIKVYALEDSTPIVAWRGSSPASTFESYISDNAGNWTALPTRSSHSTGELVGRGRAYASVDANSLYRSYDKGLTNTQHSVGDIQRDSNFNQYYNYFNPNEFRWATDGGEIRTATFTPVDVVTFDIDLEAVEVEAALDVTLDTGGPDKALVKEYDVTVTGGTFTVDLTGLSGESARIAGIEIIEVPLPFTSNDVIDPSGTKNEGPITILEADILSTSEGTALTVDSVSNPVNCTASYSSGDVTFTPTSDFLGYASFDCGISDSASGTGTVTYVRRISQKVMS